MQVNNNIVPQPQPRRQRRPGSIGADVRAPGIPKSPGAFSAYVLPPKADCSRSRPQKSCYTQLQGFKAAIPDSGNAHNLSQRQVDINIADKRPALRLHRQPPDE